MTAAIQNIQIDLELPQKLIRSKRPIRLPTFGSFIDSFKSGRYIHFQIRKIQFGFSKLSGTVGGQWCISQFTFFGGYSRRGEISYWREYTVQFELNISLYDFVQYMSTKKWFTETRPAVMLGESLFDFQAMFLRWDMNFGKRNEWATPLQLEMSRQFTTTENHLRRQLNSAAVPPSMRRKYPNREAYYDTFRRGERPKDARGKWSKINWQ